MKGITNAVAIEKNNKAKLTPLKWATLLELDFIIVRNYKKEVRRTKQIEKKQVKANLFR